MNKFLLGCGVLIVVAGIAAAGGAYYFLWRPAKAAVSEFGKLKEIPKIEQKVSNTAAFSAPADNVLTSDAVDRYVRTQNAIIAKLGPKATALSEKYEAMEKSRANFQPTWSELAGAYKDFASLIVEAKRAQVEALNESNYSLTEYDWTRQRVYEALGIPINWEIQRMIRDLAEGNFAAVEERAKNAKNALDTPVMVPEKNRALVSPHQKQLTDRAALAFFGL
jgi:hypothetical protein